jgi:hypothetical protein
MFTLSFIGALAYMYSVKKIADWVVAKFYFEDPFPVWMTVIFMALILPVTISFDLVSST